MQTCQYFKINKDKRLILFGQSDNVYTDNICDVIILMAKFYIYRCKVNGTSLILKNFIHELYNRYCIEKGVKKNDQQFFNKWYPYTDIFKSLL